MTARPYRVLVVEDEQLTAETYVAHLDRLPGFEVAAVAGSLLAARQVAAAGLHADGRFPFDVVLAYAAELLDSPNQPQQEEGEPRMVRWILDQLVGPEWQDNKPLFTGWKVTEGKTFVDFVADKIKLIPEIARTVATLPERLDRIETLLKEGNK